MVPKSSCALKCPSSSRRAKAHPGLPWPSSWPSRGDTPALLASLSGCGGEQSSLSPWLAFGSPRSSQSFTSPPISSWASRPHPIEKEVERATEELSLPELGPPVRPLARLLSGGKRSANGCQPAAGSAGPGFVPGAARGGPGEPKEPFPLPEAPGPGSLQRLSRPGRPEEATQVGIPSQLQPRQ